MSFGVPKYGDRLASAPEMQLVADPTPQQIQPAIEIDKYCRNGQHPQVALQNELSSAANAAAMSRGKCLFSFLGACQQTVTSSGVGDRTRWRAAVKTGPYTHAIGVIAVLMPPSAGYSYNTKGRIDIYSDAAETTLVATTDIIFGASNSAYDASDFSTWANRMTLIDGISPDTAYYLKFTDVDYGRLHSVCVWELPSMLEHFSGYLATNVTTHTPVTNLQRQNVVTIANDMLQKGHGHLLNWTVEAAVGPQTISTTTYTNIVDLSSTLVTSATPGWTFDQASHDRQSQASGIPCVLAGFGSFGAGTGGSIILYNSAGTTIATLNGSWGTSTSWKSTTFSLPAVKDKYDIMFKSTTGGTVFSLYAVSVYPYG